MAASRVNQDVDKSSKDKKASRVKAVDKSSKGKKASKVKAVVKSSRWVLFPKRVDKSSKAKRGLYCSSSEDLESDIEELDPEDEDTARDLKKGEAKDLKKGEARDRELATTISRAHYEHIRNQQGPYRGDSDSAEWTSISDGKVSFWDSDSAELL